MVGPQSELTAFVIDGDAARRDATALCFGREGFRFQMFADAASFLAVADAETAGCVLVEWTRAGDGGEPPPLAFLRRLRQRGAVLPVCFVGGPATAAEVRQAFRLGVADFLLGPPGEADLLGAVGEAFAAERKRMSLRRRARQRDDLFNALTRREREVASLAAQGHDNQLIGHRLGISHRTVEVHKARLMRKLGARTLADLIRLGGAAPK